MIETLVGTLFGGLFRLAPEVLKWMDRKDERAHEIAMFDKQLEADRLRGEQAERQQRLASETTITSAEINALVEATKAQATMTGVKWVDGLNALIRPLLALQWLIVLWPAVVVAGIVLATQAGIPALEAIKAAFGVEEKALATSIASFWLVDRALRKMK